MFEYGNDQVDVLDDKDSQKDIAAKVINRFHDAINWQGMERIGDVSVRTALRESYEQLNGISPACDQAVIDKLGVRAYINLTANKVTTVQPYLVETLINADQLPFIVQPTPIPDLSRRGELEVVEAVKEQFFAQQFDGNLTALIAALKTQIFGKEVQFAKDAADRMYKKMQDQCAEGGWNRALQASLTNFVTYPWATLHGPVPTVKPRAYWSGDSLRVRNEHFYEFRAVSPWDFWYTPDSTNTQDGTGVFIRERWTRQQLLLAASLKSYDKKAIEDVLAYLEKYNDPQTYRWATAYNPDQKQDNYLSMWRNDSGVVDVLIHYGKFSGKELAKYKVKVDDENAYYEAKITMVRNKVIQLYVSPNPSLYMRPVHCASFYTTHDRIANSGIAQRARSVERCYMAVLRYLLANASSSVGPITEVDFARIAQFMAPQDVAKLQPFTVYLTENAGYNNNSPAFRFYQTPNTANLYMSCMEYFQRMLDEVTNLPAALNGTAQGSGANRTFRGAAMLQGNAIKSIQNAVYNLDEGIFGNVGTMLYNYNMQYEDDVDIKGDCKVSAFGAAGLLQRELDTQRATTVLELGTQLGGAINPAVLQWAVKTFLKGANVPDDVLNAPMPPQQAPIQGELPQAPVTSEQASGAL